MRTVLLSGLLLAGLAGAGCAVGPDPARPASPAGDLDAAYLRAAAGDAAAAYEAAGWWRRFADETGERLVRDVMRQNYDLAAASARVDEAAELLDAAGGRLLPEVELQFTPSRSQRFLDIPVGTNQIDSEIYDVRVAARWEVDIWGRQRRLREAAFFRERLARADRLATAHRLVAETLRARVDLAVLGQRVRLARQDVATRRRTLDVVTDSYRAGIATAAEYELAREALLSSEAGVPPIEEAVALTRHALSVLLGRLPAEVGFEVDSFLPRLPDPPPDVGLPVALLDRRPDLLAAEFRTAAATAEVGARVADLLPDVVLRADAGFANSEVGELIDGDVVVWTLAADVVQSVFYRDVLLSRVAAAEARARASAAEYVAAVLRAVREVEDALVGGRQARLALEKLLDAADAAGRAERLALRDYQNGIGDLLRVLDASRRRQAAEDRAALARRDVWFAQINLHLALGGDWELPTPRGPVPLPAEGEPADDDDLDEPLADAGVGRLN